jgi:glycosyltransferase involved in cell wall biosynthesis
MSMTEWICSQADGVITHSSWGCDRVMKSCAGPVRVVPLAFNAKTVLANAAFNNISDDDRTLKLLTIGHVNPNKRVDSVIKAIGGSFLLKNRVNYRVIGAVTPKMKSSLYNLSADLGVNLVISGEVDDDELVRAILESDAICCLRWPVLEAASASAIESMLYGKAIIVTNAGFYADIPDSCVIKINHLNEIIELQSFLEEVIENKSRLRILGQNARLWASKIFTVDNYVCQLVEMIEQISRTTPAIKAVDNLCTILSSWSLNGDSFIVSDISKRLSIFENI